MGDPQVILTKLREFNKEMSDLNLSDAELDHLILLCNDGTFNATYLASLIKVLNWPEGITEILQLICFNIQIVSDYVFPALDVIRLAVKNDNFNKEISLKYGDILMEKLKNFINSKSTNNTLVTFRALCNICTHPYGEEIIFKWRLDLLESLTSLSTNNKNIQVLKSE